MDTTNEPVGRYYWESVADGIEMAIPSATTPHYMKDDFPLYTHPVKELTDEEIHNLMDEIRQAVGDDIERAMYRMARAILRKAQK